MSFVCNFFVHWVFRMNFNHSFLKNGIVKVESINATAGTTALSHGREISIAHIYTPIARYVNTVNKIFLVELVSHALSVSTPLFLSSIFCILCSKLSIIVFEFISVPARFLEFFLEE